MHLLEKLHLKQIKMENLIYQEIKQLESIDVCSFDFVV